MIPLLHAPEEVADPIQYVVSEMVRNVLEHADSPVGAFICAQYYRDLERLSIGIADAGVGIRNSMARSHKVTSSREAILLALQPGVTGVTARIGGNESNAGAGLFFTKSTPLGALFGLARSRGGRVTTALVTTFLLVIAAHPRRADAQYHASNDAAAFRTFSLYTDRTASAGTTDHVNLSVYPASLNNAAYMVLHTVGSVTDTVALLNSQPYDATGMEVNGSTPSSYAEFAVVPPRLATSLAVSINAYLVFAGFNQFDDFLKPLSALTVTYEDNSTWTTMLNVDQHVRGYFQNNIMCGSDVIFPATGLPYDALVVQLYASGGYFMDMQEVRLPRVHKKVSKVRVEAVSLDHFCSTFVPHTEPVNDSETLA